MEWALRSSQTGLRKHLTEKQKVYLTSKFLIGETTGRKLDAASVATSMMTAKNMNGEGLFSSDEFLTSQQISAFFSRLLYTNTANARRCSL